MVGQKIKGAKSDGERQKVGRALKKMEAKPKKDGLE